MTNLNSLSKQNSSLLVFKLFVSLLVFALIFDNKCLNSIAYIICLQYTTAMQIHLKVLAILTTMPVICKCHKIMFEIQRLYYA